MSVAKDRRTGMFFALPKRERGRSGPACIVKLADWLDALGSTQVTTCNNREPAAGRRSCSKICKKAGSVTTLETSAPAITLDVDWPREC